MGIFGNGYIINEKVSNLRKAALALKVKPRQDLAESAKKGSYPGLLNLVNKLDNIEDLEYLKEDAKTLRSYTGIIIERIESCKKGKGPDNFKYYNKIKKLYLDKNVNAKDIQRYEKWIDEVYIPRINERIKEMKKKNK